MSEYSKAHPEKELIKLGIGDVTRPIVPSVLEAMHKAVDEMGKSVKEVKDSMADSIVEYSDYIDEYGKLGFKIFFSANLCNSNQLTPIFAFSLTAKLASKTIL